MAVEKNQIDRERIFYAASKLLNNALLGVPRPWLAQQMRLAGVRFACDLENCYICLTGLSRHSYLLAAESEEGYFQSEYRVKDFLKAYMAQARCDFEFFYHNVTKEQVILFSPCGTSPPPMEVAQAIHGFVSGQLAQTMPRACALACNFTVLSPHIRAYEMLGAAFEQLSALKACAYFHMENVVFTPQLYESLLRPASLDEARKALNEIEALVLSRSAQAALQNLDRLGQTLKHSFDFQLTGEVCVMLKVLLSKWQNAYGFSLQQEALYNLRPERHLSIEGLWLAAREALTQAMAQIARAGKPFSPLTQEALSILRKQYHDQALSLAAMAGRLHVSGAHLSRTFKRDTGASFSRYLLTMRLERAGEMLACGALSVAQVARDAGIGDAAYFHRVFKRHTGMTPGQYREGAKKAVCPCQAPPGS